MKTYLSRRRFLNNSLKGIAGTFAGISFLNMAGASTNSGFLTLPDPLSHEGLFFKISLAQWSLHRSFNDNKLKAEEFPVIAKEQFNIDAVEYVNGLYAKYASNSEFWGELKQRADDHGVQSLLMMVDDEGDLGNPNEKKRKKAVEEYNPWFSITTFILTLAAYSAREPIPSTRAFPTTFLSPFPKPLTRIE